MSSDWLPARREDQTAMAENWLAVLASQGTVWNVPGGETAQLETLARAAEGILTKAKSAERTPVITAQCKEAFAGLSEKMRFIKSRWFFSPPLTDADLISLELKPRDTIPTPVHKPAGQVEADIFRPGAHLLELAMRIIGGSEPHPQQCGFRIYWGVMPPGGASVEAATGAKRELMKPPVSGEELPFSLFKKRKRERFDFDPGDSGKTAFFCIRLENGKGETGPWGSMLNAIIP